MNNQNMLTDSETNVKYQIIVNGAILAERSSMHLAEHYVSGLTVEQQNSARIVPVTSGGKQVLLG